MRMARRSGGTHKGVEEKRRSLPIYQHYTLSPGKTKSHHPEAKCNHCLKEFVCGSKQRLIRHLRKCGSITNPEQIIAETLNTLARNSATGQLNHSILEASNLLPSQISHHIHHSATHVGHSIHNSTGSSSSTITTANNHHTSSSNNNNNNNSNNISESNNVSAQNTSGSSLLNNHALVAGSSNGSIALNDVLPVKRPLKRGRKPGTRNSIGPGIQITTGVDGKTHYTATTQFQEPQSSGPQMITQVHNGRGFGYTSYQASTGSSSIGASRTHLNTGNSSQMPCTTVSHNSAAFKLNPEPIDKAYLKLVVTRNLPLSLCDTKEFHSWLKTFANDYKPPTSINLIAQNLKNDAQAAKQRVSNILVKAPKKTINLELHSWPHELRGHSWYAIIAGIDHKRFLLSVKDVANTMNNDAINSAGTVIQKCVPSDKALTEFVDDCIKRVGSDRVNSLLFAEMRGDDDLITRTRQSIYTNHPSIVTFHCWWHFTNLLCLDIVEQIDVYRIVLRNSKLLMNFISKRPQLSLNLERFSPFAGYANSFGPKREDPRWYSHIICYLFEYLKNNHEAILKALENYSPSTHSDNNNNNNSSGADNKSRSDVQQNSTSSTQQPNMFCQDVQLIETKSIVMSTEYWANLNSALVHLKSIRDIVALTANLSNQTPCSNANNQPGNSSPKNLTQAISTISTSNLSLSEYMRWYLDYGKLLLDNWGQSQDNNKFKMIRNYLERFSASLSQFKLLFAAYLLNPRNRCAYVTQKAKDLAIEEILNIASEFMPEESDGHTIFDQWKLYLVREEPYDVSYDETRSTPLEWWLSLPCAESIRRVALRILRLRAFTSPKPEFLFSQLYFYEDEAKTSLSRSTFEDLATMRYFYDYEDKIGQQASLYSSSQNHSHNHSIISLSSNGYQDRTQSGLIHNQYLHDADDPDNFLPSGSPQVVDSNGRFDDSIPVNEQSKTNFPNQYSDIVEPYLNQSQLDGIDSQTSLNNASNLSVENLPEYAQFAEYVDFNLLGIQIVEEPTEKKKRKWTAQEILSKQCQNNHQSGGNINNDI